VTANPDPAGAGSPLPADRQRPSRVVDLHLVWERQLIALGRIDLAVADEPTFLAVCARIEHLERLILRSRARTLAGAMVQVRLVAANMAQRGEGDEREGKGLRLALATLAQWRDRHFAPLPGSTAAARRAPA
jgi:hypothetical protein